MEKFKNILDKIYKVTSHWLPAVIYIIGVIPIMMLDHELPSSDIKWIYWGLGFVLAIFNKLYEKFRKN